MKKTGLLILPIMAFSFLVGCGNKQKWYKRSNWWNYCSCGVSGVRATFSDIGKVVDIPVDGLIHKVRLIDINHDTLASNTSKKVHCTFEFAELISKTVQDDIEYYSVTWNGEAGNPDAQNHDFPSSKLNTFLNGTSANDINGSVLEMLPNDLRKVIKVVNKKVGVSTDGGDTYLATEYQTRLFPLAYDEITTNATEEPRVEGEGTIYKYYDNVVNKKRIKKKVGVGTYIYAGEKYWLRSPQTNSYAELGNVFAFNVLADGAVNSSVVSLDEIATAPAFCI